MRSATLVNVITILVYCAGTPAYSWGSRGHRIINLKSAKHLLNSMAALKADSVFYEAHASDADNRKNSNDTLFFAEAQRHFIDIDRYPDYAHLPHNRDSLVALYGWETVKRDGTLPWATQMVLDSLTAQLRRGDTSATKYSMSDLGHYVADAHQPLHCTWNYDGQATNNSGIHSRYETGMINVYGGAISISPDSVRYVFSPLDFVFAYIHDSNALVDSIMRADNSAKAASGWNGSATPPAAYYAALWEKTASLTAGQFQRATVALASLWYTAWVNAGRTTSVYEFAEVVPYDFRLEQNFPNPFNPVTHIAFQVPDFSVEGRSTSSRGLVRLLVYNVLGQEVAVLVNEMKPPGTYLVQFDATGCASGTYFYRFTVLQPDLPFTSSSPTGQPGTGAGTPRGQVGQGGALVLTKRLVILK